MEYTVTNYATGKAYTGSNLAALQAAGIENGHKVITLNQYAEAMERPLWPSDEFVAENAPKGMEKSFRVNTYKTNKKSLFATGFNQSTKGHWVKLSGGRFSYFVIDTMYCTFGKVEHEEKDDSPVIVVSAPQDTLDFTAEGKTFRVRLDTFKSFTISRMKKFLACFDKDHPLNEQQKNAIVATLQGAKAEAQQNAQDGHISAKEASAKKRVYTSMINLVMA